MVKSGLSRVDSVAKNGITAEEDAAYKDAVERGDMETASRMVRDAAEKAGYTSVPRYHHTNAKFTKFDASKSRSTESGYFFSNDISDTKKFGENTITAFLKFNKSNPWIGDRVGDVISREQFDMYLRGIDDVMEKNGLSEDGRFYGESLFSYDRFKDKSIADAISMPMYDRKVYKYGDEFRKAFADATGFDGARSGSWAQWESVFTPEQIKSADPVTYDDDGDVIQLSKRFDFTNPDIRY